MVAMHSWPIPSFRPVPGDAAQLRLYDSANQTIAPVEVAGDTATMYVCGITPYDSTHLGHAATYLTFDLIYRAFLDAGKKVHYVQNITDVDDPLFERAERDGVDWRELGTSQIDLFRSDMELLDAFRDFDYPNEIGPGVYDIHSPRVPSVAELTELVASALQNGIHPREWDRYQTQMRDLAGELDESYVPKPPGQQRDIPGTPPVTDRPAPGR